MGLGGSLRLHARSRNHRAREHSIHEEMSKIDENMMRAVTTLILSALTLHAAESSLCVGFGEVDISPTLGKKPVFLAGFGDNRKATKLHDPLMARAVVFSDGKEKIAIVSVDVVGLFLASAESVRSQCPGYKYICVSATHNHHGPDTL